MGKMKTDKEREKLANNQLFEPQLGTTSILFSTQLPMTHRVCRFSHLLILKQYQAEVFPSIITSFSTIRI